MTRDPKRVADKYIARDGGEPEQPDPDAGWKEAAREYHADRDHVASAPPVPSPLDDLIERAADDIGAAFEASSIAALAKLRNTNPAEYEVRREQLKAIGVRVSALDKLVGKQQAQAGDDAAALPHWKVEPWKSEVGGAALLDDIKAVFEHYIVLPTGAGDALALWVLHAWTMDAGDISPFMVLVSPTKRCGKTNVLILLLYLTPRSELASNISASALFRYVEDVRPTLLIDEADSFVKDNEEMRGILNSGHTKAAAHVIRNVEVNGEHKARRFSTWAPKAIATIRALADTLEDRAIVVTLQRKPMSAKVARLRKRDSDEFAILRQRAARWAADNCSKLTDPDPATPPALNDRASDNWRPLLAIAELAEGRWPARAREAACILSGEGHDSTSVNVELLADIRDAFGDRDVLRSADLVEKLTADKERPWVEWRHGKPLTPKQLGGLLAPFGITSETVSIPGLADAKGYRRTRFEEAWEAYLPGQNTLRSPDPPSETSKRRNPDGSSTTRDFRSVAGDVGDGSKNGNLSHSHAASDASTFQKPPSEVKGCSDQKIEPPADLPEAAAEAPPTSPDVPAPAAPAPSTEPMPTLAPVESPQTAPDDDIPDFCRRCVQCGAPSDSRGSVIEHEVGDGRVWLHRECRRFYAPTRGPLGDLRCMRRTPRSNPPALGPAGDSLDDFKP
jgi:putative DNA primase/helicase